MLIGDNRYNDCDDMSHSNLNRLNTAARATAPIGTLDGQPARNVTPTGTGERPLGCVRVRRLALRRFAQARAERTLAPATGSRRTEETEAPVNAEHVLRFRFHNVALSVQQRLYQQRPSGAAPLWRWVKVGRVYTSWAHIQNNWELLSEAPPELPAFRRRLKRTK